MNAIFPVKDGYIDAGEELRKFRRVITKKLNDRKKLAETTHGVCPCAFEDIQHFYNAMTFAIMALEEAYASTSKRK